MCLVSLDRGQLYPLEKLSKRILFKKILIVKYLKLTMNNNINKTEQTTCPEPKETIINEVRVETRKKRKQIPLIERIPKGN